MDLLAFFVIFAMTYAAGGRPDGLRECFWMGIVFPASYMFSSVIAGRFLNRKNASSFLLGSTLGMLCAGIFGLYAAGLWQVSIAIGIIGALLALFFNAFQTFMRGETIPGGLARTAARYTLAWNAGTAAGLIISGYLYSLGQLLMAIALVLIAAAIIAIIVFSPKRGHDEESCDESVEHSPEGSRPVSPAFVLVAWLMLFTVMFAQRPLTTFFPMICAQSSVSPFLASLPIFSLFILQGIAGFFMPLMRSELYRKRGIAISHLIGIASMLFAWLVPCYWASFVSFCALAPYAGFVYFSAVYYSSNSGNRTFNVAVNEAVVGLGSLAGVFACDYWAKKTGDIYVMYLVCAVAIFLSMIVQKLHILKSHRKAHRKNMRHT